MKCSVITYLSKGGRWPRGSTRSTSHSQIPPGPEAAPHASCHSRHHWWCSDTGDPSAVGERHNGLWGGAWVAPVSSTGPLESLDTPVLQVLPFSGPVGHSAGQEAHNRWSCPQGQQEHKLSHFSYPRHHRNLPTHPWLAGSPFLPPGHTLTLTNGPVRRKLAWHYYSHFISEAAKAQKGPGTLERPCR